MFSKGRLRIAMIIFSLYFATTGSSANATALSLQQAKQQGMIGEANNGYVASVLANPPHQLTLLIKQVNDKRKQAYRAISQQNSMSPDDVAARAYQKAIKKTLPGDYFQTKLGEWVKK